MQRHVMIALIVGVVEVHAGSELVAQTPATTQFVFRHGADTVAVEEFNRDGSVVTGRVVQTNGISTQYIMNIRADNSVAHLEQTRKGPDGAPTLSLDFGENGIKGTAQSGGGPGDVDVTTPKKPTPFLINSFAMAEQVVRASKLSVGRDTAWTALMVGVRDTATIHIKRLSADSTLISGPRWTMRLATDGAGSVLGGQAIFAGGAMNVERRVIAGKH